MKSLRAVIVSESDWGAVWGDFVIYHQENDLVFDPFS
jgi:hypothetical protein